MFEEIRILGVKLHNVNFNHTIEAIDGFIRKRDRQNLIVTLGTEMVMKAQSDEVFKNIVNNASLVCADGVGLLWAAKKYGYHVKEKVAGVELLERLVELSGRKKWKLFFFGAAPGTAQEAKIQLLKKYPDANIVGEYHGFFEDDSEVKTMLRQTSPDILFLALGSPKQELWYIENAGELDIPVGIGVGGSLDVMSGKVDRAPGWMIKLGLEWFYRLYKEPSRWKRMMALPKFAIKILLTAKKAQKTPNAEKNN